MRKLWIIAAIIAVVALAIFVVKRDEAVVAANNKTTDTKVVAQATASTTRPAAQTTDDQPAGAKVTTTKVVETNADQAIAKVKSTATPATEAKAKTEDEAKAKSTSTAKTSTEAKTETKVEEKSKTTETSKPTNEAKTEDKEDKAKAETTPKPTAKPTPVPTPAPTPKPQAKAYAKASDYRVKAVKQELSKSFAGPNGDILKDFSASAKKDFTVYLGVPMDGYSVDEMWSYLATLVYNLAPNFDFAFADGNLEEVLYSAECDGRLHLIWDDANRPQMETLLSQVSDKSEACEIVLRWISDFTVRDPQTRARVWLVY